MLNKDAVHSATPQEVKKLLESEIADPEGPVFLFKGWCKRCGICVELCPRKVYEWGEDGYPVASYPDKCTHCFLCEFRCPDFAITVLRSRK